MAGMRDKVIHFYFGVNREAVWIAVKDVTLKMDPLQIVTIRKLATMKSIPYQTLIRHWLADKTGKELASRKGNLPIFWNCPYARYPAKRNW
jgi:hypothetical protein